MTSRELLLKGGENGQVLDLQAPGKSVLLDSLTAGADPHMPPKKQLSAAQIEVFPALGSSWRGVGRHRAGQSALGPARSHAQCAPGGLPARSRPRDFTRSTDAEPASARRW